MREKRGGNRRGKVGTRGGEGKRSRERRRKKRRRERRMRRKEGRKRPSLLLCRLYLNVRLY